MIRHSTLQQLALWARAIVLSADGVGVCDGAVPISHRSASDLAREAVRRGSHIHLASVYGALLKENLTSSRIWFAPGSRPIAIRTLKPDASMCAASIAAHRSPKDDENGVGRRG
ncbi:MULTISPECIES: hypothetical protein [unclassified Mesorhizobium]|uniref:hypothetical protein n=1 Tax=unclassified Mesorhizobium TaxID=325217 RepID=UPI003338277E